MSNPEPESIQEITPELTLEWYDSQRLAVLTITSVTQATIDAFLETLAQVEQNWQPDLPMMLMIDLQHRNVGLTPYLRQKMDELINRFQRSAGRYAFIMSDSVLTQSLQLFFGTILRTQGKLSNTNICFSREAGFRWITGDN